MKMKNVEDAYPLSPMQRGILFQSLSESNQEAYVEQISWRLNGKLNTEAIKSAWERVIERHAILRTCFFWEGLAEPLQVVRQRVRLPWVRHDWSGFSRSEQEQRLAPYLASDRRAFNLSQAPLMRLVEIILGPESHHYVWTYHHLLLDAWSVSLVLAEVLRCYDAHCRAEQLKLAPSRPYRDYIGWLNQQDVTIAAHYWRETLNGFTGPTPLLVTRRQESNSKYDQKQVSELIEADGLRDFAMRHQLTLNTLVQGAWAIVLSRYSEERDVVFGNVVSGRPTSLKGFAEMVGLFINTLPLRVSVKPGTRVLDYLKSVQARQSAMQQYEWASVKQVREGAGISGSQLLFDSLMVFDNTPLDDSLSRRHGNVEITEFARADSLTGHSLTLEVAPQRDLTLRLVYDGSRFEEDTMRRVLSHLRNVLTSFTRSETQALDDLPLLTEAERREILVDWGRARVQHQTNECLHTLFEAQAARTPERYAVTFEQVSLTYRELNERANLIARQLRNVGVGAETIVGLCTENSIATVIGILAILKAGGAYVPLDPEYPRERLVFMLQDSQVSVLLMTRRFLERFKDHTGHIILIDEDASASQSTGNLDHHETPDNLAYIIYTSGSTGRPKGVQVSHRNVTRLFQATSEYFGFAESDVWTFFHSFAFDFSVWELWGALLHGGRLVVVTRSQSRLPQSFYRLLIDEKVSVLNQTPSAFGQLMKAADGFVENTSLRLVIFGGETLDPKSLAGWFKRNGDAHPRLVNMYGITETTVHVTQRQLTTSDVQSGGSVIGHPLSDLECYVLDGDMRPVPVGVIGELYIGGSGVARGYVNRSDLTAERFVPNPFGGEAGSRLYRTGDRAFYRNSGELEYVGRIDDQIKINGFRVELGEIESNLREHPQVEAVAVVLRTLRGEKRLVSYVVSGAGATPAANELRQFLRERLPQYMIPSQFVALTSLPLTPSGKLDRRALPSPDLLHIEMEEAFVPPRTATERMLAEIWSQTLGVEQVGIHDNFFALGGDSILSMQVVTRARQMGLRLSARDPFMHQTIAELACLESGAETVPAEQDLVTGTLPLTPIQAWFFEEHLVAPQHYNQSLLLRARQPFKAHLLRRVVAQLVAHHDALRPRFTPASGRPVQHYAETEEATIFSHVDLSALPESQHARAVEDIATRLQSSLDLVNGPLMRVALFERPSHLGSLLLIIIHHLAVDGVSWRILLEDIQTFYEQLNDHGQITPPLKTTSFKQWAEKLVEHSQTQTIKQEADYWLAEAGVLPLPVDGPGGDNSVASGERASITLSPEETQMLLQTVPRAYRTRIDEVLLTALSSAFAKWTGNDSVLIDVEGHGREAFTDNVDPSRTVGWFTSLYPVLLNVKSGAAPEEKLKSIKDQLRAVPNRGLGYALLKYADSNEDIAVALRKLPQAEVSFNYLGHFTQPLALFLLDDTPIGPTRSPLQRRQHVIEIDGGIEAGRLQLSWTYSRNLHRRTTVEGLAQTFATELRNLIASSQAPKPRCLTPSDFPLAKLTPAALDGLAANASDIEDIYPLSPMQEGMLFHALDAPKANVYLEQLSIGLQGPVDVAALERAWQTALDRHATLRTGFVWQGLDEPLQVVHRSVQLPLELHDWRALSPPQQQEATKELLQNERERGFNLSTAPLMRLTLVRLAEQEHLFIWCYHHIVLDGWSVPILLKEVFLTYESLRQGQPAPPLPPDYRPYRDYIEWLQHQDMSDAASYWRETLEGFKNPTLVVGDPFERPPLMDRNGDSEEQHLKLSADLTLALTQFARTHELTLNTLVQGAWAILLSRYSREPEVLFGATVAGRPAELSGAEAMVGIFINTLPLRLRVSNRRALMQWLKSIQERQGELAQYAYTPLTLIQGSSDVPKGRSLFQSILVFENYPAISSLSQGSGNTEISQVYKPERTNYPLMLVIAPGTELSLKLLFDPRCFSPAFIKQMLGHLNVLLTKMLEGGKQRLGNLTLLTESERHEILTTYNNTRASYPAESCFAQMFETQARRVPDAPAVVCGNEQLSYAALNQGANQLAHRLRTHGVGPETTVGVLLERSVEILVALLGIWKAGGAFVPMEPSHPPEYLAFVANDAGLSALVTQARFAESIPDQCYPVLCLDADREALERESTQDPIAISAPRNLAYVIYTSGTTGKPKGVMIEHRSLINHLCWMEKKLKADGVCLLPAVTGLTFDASLKQLLVPLLRGDMVWIWQTDTLGDPVKFMNELRTGSDMGLNCVPSLWQAMLNTILASEVEAPKETLKHLFLGGEKPERELIEKTFAALPDLRVWNLYGPTEATVNASVAELRRGVVINIGRPATNVEMFVLDEELCPTPHGVSGDLFIGGAGIARGYLGHAAATAESFIPHPFSDEPGARLYRTNDVVRYLADGNIEYLGRRDRQIKLRGYRIELDEIENILRQHPDVRDTAVQMYDKEPRDGQLAAYVVPRAASVSISELREFLKKKLPFYMVPLHFLILDELPLTDNGKLDRRALPAPEPGGTETETNFVAPRTKEEKLLSEIWSKVLSVEQVGIHDNFFELGGDSILSIRIVARAGQAGIKLTPRLLLEHPTIAELIAHAGATGSEVANAMPLTPVQRDLLHKCRGRLVHSHYVTALEARQPIDYLSLMKVLRQVIITHDALRLRFTHDPAGDWQQWEAGLDDSLSLVELDLSELTQVQQESVFADLTSSRLVELDEGPAIRGVLCRRGVQTPDLLILIIYSPTADEVSCHILTEDLQTGYSQLSRGEANGFAHQVTSFRQWAEAVNANSQDEYQIREQLTEYSSGLPLDCPEGVRLPPSARTLALYLNVAETKLPLNLVAGVNHWRVEDVLVTALLQGLATWTGRRSCLIDLEVTGRNGEFLGIDLSRTVGRFDHFVPARLSLPEGRGLGEALRLVEEQLRSVRRHFKTFNTLTRAEISIAQAHESDFDTGAAFAPAAWFDALTVLGPYLLRLRWQIVHERLQLSWTYNANVHQPATIEQLSGSTLSALRSLLAYLQNSAPRDIATNFPEANLSRRELDILKSTFEKWE